MPVEISYVRRFNRQTLAEGQRAGPGLVGYLGREDDLTVYNVGDPLPAGAVWDVGTFRVNADGFILEQFRINAEVVCYGSNPVFRQGVVECGPGSTFGITVNGAGRGVLTVEDVTVRRSSPATFGDVQTNGISSDSALVARRCDVSGSGDGIHVVAGGGSLVSQCCVHDLAFVDPEQHLDPIQVFSGTGGAVTVEHCWVGPAFAADGTPPNSSITCGFATNSGPIITPTIRNNYFASGLYHLRIGYRVQGAVVTGNDLGDLSPREFGLVAVSEPGSVATWQNNRDDGGTLIPPP
ncbi:hypothetical protein ACU635_50595 [[Actinomadura] parvosata]|uniref:hypothetical protein n=1 Tax=[Actinomadura] parvosata TaxID=1955412 RepID=UPI00406C2905